MHMPQTCAASAVTIKSETYRPLSYFIPTLNSGVVKLTHSLGVGDQKWKVRRKTCQQR